MTVVMKVMMREMKDQRNYFGFQGGFRASQGLL